MSLVRALSALGGVGPVLVLSLLGCEPVAPTEPSALDYVRVPSPDRAARTSRSQGLGSADDALRLYLNFCREDCTFTPGIDDARQRTSSIPRSPVTLPESVMSYEEHDELVRCLYQIFEPFELVIVDERPVGYRYVEAVIAGTPRDLGLSPTIAGVSPLACGLIEYGINFNFFRVIPRIDGIDQLCSVIAHETGHTIGLEHAYLCSDVMTYLPHCEDPAFFTRADAECGGFFREPCTCGGDYQNSYHTVVEELGPRKTPIELPPRLRILSPEPGVAVERGYFVVLDATDEAGIEQVELFLDDQSQGVLREPPFAFATPLDWPLGIVSIRAVATNGLGRTSTATRELEVTKRMPPWDAGFLDAAGPRPDAGMSWSPADASVVEDLGGPSAIPEAGCSCWSAAKTRVVGLEILLLLPLLMLRPRSRSHRLLGTVLVLGALFGCEDDAFRGVQPKLVSRPAAGEPIDFGELILGERSPRPRDIVFVNEGEGSLVLEAPVTGPSPVGALEITGPLRRRVDPGGATELIIALHPERPGLLETELSLATNDPEHPIARHPLRATVRERCRLLPWPTALDFRVSDERRVSLLSASTSPCRVTAVSIDERIFELVDPPAFPIDLPPGEELDLVVRHHTRTKDPHVPLRTMRVHEAETEGADVRLIGAYPIWKCLAVYPTEYEFPRTAAGASSELLLSLTNRCEEDALVEGIAMPYGAEAFRLLDQTFPMTVPALGRLGIGVAFSPPDGLDYYGRVRVNTNDAGNLALRAGMLGRAIGPVFGAPSRLDLGAVPFSAEPNCRTPDRTLPVFNLGEGALSVHDIRVDGEDRDGFEVTGVEIAGELLPSWRSGFQIPPLGWAEIQLSFRPLRGAPIEHRAELVIEHTPDRKTHRIALAGRAAGTPEEVEQFLVSPPDVDVLFVVDGSRSMTARRRQLSALAEDFMARAEMETAGYQVALVSAHRERPEGGRLLGCRFRDPVIVGGEAPVSTQAEDFACALGTNQIDERPQAGLAAAALVMTRASFPSEWDPTMLDNRRFLRPDKPLAIFFVSDEDDVAPGSVELHHELYVGSKGGRADLLRIGALVVPAGRTCPGERHSVPGQRYTRAAALSHGEAVDICAADLSAPLDQLADLAFAPERGFPLSRWASPSSIVVSVNGAPALLDPETGYDFDRQTNTIVFATSAAPALGDVVEVRYRSVCAP